MLSSVSAIKGAMLIVIICTTAAASAADVYRWKNEQGNTVVSDRPPAPGVDYDVISAKTGQQVTVPAQSQEVIPAPPQTKSDQPLPKISQFSAPEKDPELCAQAKENLDLLETRPRIRYTDKDGEIRFMSDEQRAIEKEKSREAISAYCK